MILVPTYVFLEAALAFLGLSDLYLPTWSKVINDAHMAVVLADLNGNGRLIVRWPFLLETGQ